MNRLINFSAYPGSTDIMIGIDGSSRYHEFPKESWGICIYVPAKMRFRDFRQIICYESDPVVLFDD